MLFSHFINSMDGFSYLSFILIKVLVTQVGFEPTTYLRMNSLGNYDGHPLRFTGPYDLFIKVIGNILFPKFNFFEFTITHIFYIDENIRVNCIYIHSEIRAFYVFIIIVSKSILLTVC